ncbi:MAG: PEP-CTERM sorting domain-containing protein [Candidatus Acidiferrum sp.]
MLLPSKAILLPVLLIVAGFATANAEAQTTFTFGTPAGAASRGEPVDALATFTIQGDTVTVSITDMEANPTSIAQALSGIDFDLNSGQKWGVLTSSSAQRIKILQNGAFVMGNSGATGWRLDDGFQGGLQLTALDFRGGDALLIGPPAGGTYSDANRSIAGNGHHRTFLDQTATFVLTIPCLKGLPTITDVTFLFANVGSHSECASGTKIQGDPSVTPEPATMLLFGSGLAALGAFRRKHRAAA